ncbi:MAG: Loki-CTERM sorting domain-containing protein [Promethearchaeota archaeon]|jgi:hypothetical protein
MLGILGVYIILPVRAATSQWFPSVGTATEYSVSNYLTKWDYTRGESNAFNIYNQSGNKYIVPTYMDLSFPEMPLSWDLIETNSRISVLIDYTERSATELYRNTRIKINDITYNDTNYKFVGARELFSWLTSDMTFTSELNYINKNSFLPNNLGAFYDYIDCSLGVGSKFPVDVEVISVSKDYIIATTNNPLFDNQTYLADSNGKVISFTLTFFHPMMNLIGHRSTNFVFTLQQDLSKGIPGFDLYIILSILGIISTILISRKFRK